jgi:hypothetical protein
MRTRLAVLGLLGLALAALLARSHAGRPAADAKGPMVVHNVFFSLKDNSAAAKKRLTQACGKYLTKHPGEVYFAAGPRVEDLTREVNDRDFDVALTIVFRDRASHDQYQDAKRHKQFIAENRDNWKKVRVFDSLAHK